MMLTLCESSGSKAAIGLALLCLMLMPPTGAKADLIAIDTPWRQARDNAFARAINPDDYECDPTDLEEWVIGKIVDIGWRDVVVLVDEGAFDWVFYYSLLLDNDASGSYIGVNSEHTRELLKRHKDNQRFWGVPTEDILLLGMHGAVIAEDTRIVPAVQLYYLFQRDELLSSAAAQGKVDRIRRLITRNPNLHYDHPLFTFNAFAFSAGGQDLLGNGEILPDKIVMGDGILTALRDLGFDQNAPDYVHAHEFAHHVQFELGVFDDYEGSPEETRRTELMADSFAGYYCAHARGATLQAKRFAEVRNLAYSIGDCAFDEPAHHGTPNQREAAATWGANMAAPKTKRGHVHPATRMIEFFDAELPNLIAPDAP